MTHAFGEAGSGPLAGVRVLDLTINVLGPVATQQLGDMGASVIKVEPPEGDPMRDNGPGRNPHMSALFLNLNRNKRSIRLDLKQPAQREALFKLAGDADVLVHSMRSNAAMRLGLDYPTLHARFPRLIYASAPGYSPDGPYRDRPAYDDVIQGESGVAGLVQASTGVPAYFPTVLADKLCGVYLASAIGMALYSRDRTGHGQEVQIPMFETMVSFNLMEHLWTSTFGAEGRPGYARALSKHRRPYATLDGYICLMAVNDAQWKRLLAALERPELAADERFSTLMARTANIDALYEIVAHQITLRSTAHWHARLDEADIPNAPMNTLADLPNHPYLNDTGFFERYEHHSEGTLVRTAVPQRFSETPPAVRYGAPGLGEHNADVLRTLGYDDDAIRAMSGAVSGVPADSKG